MARIKFKEGPVFYIISDDDSKSIKFQTEFYTKNKVFESKIGEKFSEALI